MGASPAGLSGVRVYDDTISAQWTERLRGDVTAHSEKLRFFWFRLGDPPRSFFEQVIAHLHAIARPSAACCGVEYWSRVQDAVAPFHFHYDRDVGEPKRIVTPSMSSILYLSDVGGPTLIVDSTAGDSRVPKRGVGVTPHRRRFVTFAGDLLHGVWPGDASRWPRIAFFVNWWTHRPRACVDPPRAASRWSPLVERPASALRTRPRRVTPGSFRADQLIDAAGWRRELSGKARSFVYSMRLAPPARGSAGR